jgi:hypothetical protein
LNLTRLPIHDKAVGFSIETKGSDPSRQEDMLVCDIEVIGVII